ncbi:carbon-nitrogen hydrolase family protein [Mesorhizobium sp. SB112]|uniref:carbon-nitrogen hydrolase family protein n=1 Tax=Mesorhizobium sp. SB112 TaxID=3151853 RepID=UPI003263091A
MTVCAFVEWPEDLRPSGPVWDSIRHSLDKAAPDLLVTNELPFGRWIASAEKFDAEAARKSMDAHDEGIIALRSLGIGAVISSRPVLSGDRLANEAFVLEHEQIRALHRKQLFPNEEGWYEARWYEGDENGFEIHEIAGLKVGILLCTELMFNEHARHYGRAGADLIAVPRASGTANARWTTAAAMAAIVSGSYVVSSNRSGQSQPGPLFGGNGMAFAPDGTLIAATSAESSIATISIDTNATARQKKEYPCYVPELPVRC